MSSAALAQLEVAIIREHFGFDVLYSQFHEGQLVAVHHLVTGHCPQVGRPHDGQTLRIFADRECGILALNCNDDECYDDISYVWPKVAYAPQQLQGE